VLALLVALASGTVMTAVAGARRGHSVVDRLLSGTLPTTVVVLPNEPGFDWDAVRALPEVEALTQFAVSDFRVDELTAIGIDNPGSFPFADDDVFRTIERPYVLDGRLLDPDAVDEVVVSPAFVSRVGRGVGDTVTLRLFSPEQADGVFTAEGAPSEPEGPAVEATIVGVIRSPWFVDTTENPSGGLVPSPALFTKYEDNFLGVQRAGYINALVRLRGGEADIPSFERGLAEVAGRSDIDVWNQSDQYDHSREVTGFESRSLLLFALAAAIAAVFLVGQAISRYAAAAVNDLQVVRAFGLSPGEARLAATLGPAVASVGGVAVGIAGAVVASRWFPIGTASRLEPHPGLDVDATVLLVAGALVVLAVAGAALLAAAVGLRAATAGAPTRPSAIVAAVARTAAPPPLVVGTRLALERGAGRHAVPVRPALLGAAIGVLGIIGALTFSNGVHDASRHPERFGQTYELMAFFGFNGQDFVPADEVLAGLADDPDVAAVVDTPLDVAKSADTAVNVFAYEPVGTPLDIVVTDGRMPLSPGEIAMAPRTADALGVSVGDTLDLAGTSGNVRADVTGIAFVPMGPHNDYATGSWVTGDTYDDLFDGYKFHLGLVGLREGVDPEAVAARINGDLGGELLAIPEAPGEAAELREVERLPLLLAAFLALLALGAVGHALATAVRRRRHDLAALRALGMTAGQVRAVVLTHATILAAFGVVVGVPLGLALGRNVWRYVAEQTPLDYLPPLAMLALVIVGPAALALANLLAAVPSQRAAAMNVGRALRTE
jgi:ABC-type lipoprotein release transport system permease subunit